MKTGKNIVALACMTIAFAVGCSSNKHPTTRPVTMYDRQEKALQDPFSYSPNIEKQNIGGGASNQYDHDGMKKDIDHVLNP